MPKGNSYTIGAAAVTLDPNTGAVKSMGQNTKYILGSKNFGETVVNWGVDTKYGGSGGFQFGSTEKAFTLVTALEKGLPINTTVNAKQASPSQAASYTNADLPDPCGVPKERPAWNVRNDETAGGQMSITQATARSINTAFIALAGAGRGLQRPGDRDPDGAAPRRRQPDLQGRPVGHHPRDPGGLADDGGERLRVAGQQRHPLHADPGAEHPRRPDGKELPFDKPGTQELQGGRRRPRSRTASRTS